MAVHVLHLVNVPAHLDLLDPIAQVSIICVPLKEINFK
jgi:hypothetical protein